MKYWDRIVHFHERGYKDFPTGEEGLRAVKFLRSFFEKMGFESLPSDHPLRNRLGAGYEPNYLWLVQYGKKIQKASHFSGFEHIAKRLINPKEYLAAHNEIEVALKLSLEGLNVSFLSADSQHAPDLILRLNNDITRIEVSSLNPPEEETRFRMFLDPIIHLSFSRGVVSGGYVNKLPSPKKMKELVVQVKESIDRSKEEKKVEKLNFKGVATIYIAPIDLVDQIPADCRGSFHFVGPRKRKPIEYQIQQKIEKKSRQLFGDNESGLLFLYTLMIGKEEVLNLFKNDMDDIVAILASYPKLLGLVLTVPHNEIRVVSGINLAKLKHEYKENKIFLECEAGKYQYESIVIWKNLHSEGNFPEEIFRALKNYSSNLSNLEPLQLNK